MKLIKTVAVSLSFICVALLGFGAARADNIVQGFNSDGSLAPGWIAALKDGSTATAAPAKDTSKIYGVVIDPSDAPIALSQNSSGQVFVATGGDYSVLVAAEHGPISAGDYVSLSSSDGIGARAVSTQGTVLGRADTGFDGKSGVINGSGDTAVGRILVHINIGPNPGYKKDETVNSQLQRYAKLFSGKNVSPVRLYTALAIFLGSFTAAVALLISGVRSGLISIGRNPLSKTSIIRSLIQVAILSVIIFLTGLTAVYLILKV